MTRSRASLAQDRATPLNPTATYRGTEPRDMPPWTVTYIQPQNTNG